MLGMNRSSRSARRRRFADIAPQPDIAPQHLRERQQQERQRQGMPPALPPRRTFVQPRRLVSPTISDRALPHAAQRLESRAPERLSGSRRRRSDSPRFSLRSLIFGLAKSAPAVTVSHRLPPRRMRAIDRPHPAQPRIAASVTPARSRIEPSRFEPLSSVGVTAPQRHRLRPAAEAKRRPRRPASPLLYVARLVILGVGIGSIAGTLLSVFDPALRQGDVAQAVRSTEVQQSIGGQPATASNVPSAVAIGQGQEITALKTTVQALTAQAAGLTPGVFLVDVDTGAYLDLNGSSTFSAASMIKVPVLVALLQGVDSGKIRLDESLTLKSADVATGSGEMQYQPIGTRYSILETAFQMITVSDNTATNLLIARLGGSDALNQQFRQWGLTSTTIHNPLPDLEGTNTTTPKELAELLAKVNQGELLSIRSRDRMFDIMRRTQTNTLLPAGLAPNATIAHKTGDIGSMVGDTGVIDMPNGKRYVMTVMVQRPHNDDRAQELIRQISRVTYDYLSKSQPADASQTLGNSGANSDAPDSQDVPARLGQQSDQ